MWPQTFDHRLKAWRDLRDQCRDHQPSQGLAEINSWWFRAPWRPYALHWDDQSQWPDPWQLLHDNVFCDIARGLGILYTIALLDHPAVQDAELICTGSHNLVLAQGGKYILNWEPHTIVNINLGTKTPQHRITQQQVIDKIR